jgi:dCTP deaminase
MGIGILSPKEVLELYQTSPKGIWRPSGEELDDLVDKSSIDLPLGSKYWVMKGSCRIGKGMKVSSDLIPRFSQNPTPQRLEGDLRLHTDKVYLFEADCELNLRDTCIQQETDTSIRGKATAKSSIGRLDVLVRLLSDDTSEFDRVVPGYRGQLYIEVTPITFNIIVRPGTCLSQLRLFRGSDRLVNITREEFQYEEQFPVVGERFESPDSHEVSYPFRLDLSPDPGSEGFSGFMATKGCTEPIDPGNKDSYDPHEFWAGVPAHEDAIELQPDRLYILRSKERLSMPGHIALECQAYTETMGEWRIEYAGFAHPYFGSMRKGGKGSPLMFEVRGHNIPTILTDGIPLGNVCFKRMSKPVEPPKEMGAYENQELKLSSCFRDWS